MTTKTARLSFTSEEGVAIHPSVGSENPSDVSWKAIARLITLFGMKTNGPFAMAVIPWSNFASDAFALLRPSYPRKPYTADRIVIIGEEKHNRVGTHLENRNKP